MPHVGAGSESGSTAGDAALPANVERGDAARADTPMEAATPAPLAAAWEERMRNTLELCLTREGGAERGTSEARELGAAALAEGVRLTELADLLWRVVSAALAGNANRDALTLEHTKRFVLACLAAFEVRLESTREVNESLRQAEERLEAQARRIAQELHDEAGQLLATVHVALEGVRPHLLAGQERRLEPVTDLLQKVEDELRHIAHELRPALLADLGLVPALRYLGEGVARRSGLRIEVVGSTNGPLPDAIETAIYRAAQEALSNVARHSGASWAVVRVRRGPREIECRIRDDGRGFEPGGVLAACGREGIGLEGLRDRIERHGGSVTITSRPGNGAEIVMRIPLRNPNARSRADRG